MEPAYPSESARSAEKNSPGWIATFGRSLLREGGTDTFASRRLARFMPRVGQVSGRLTTDQKMISFAELTAYAEGNQATDYSRFESDPEMMEDLRKTRYRDATSIFSVAPFYANATRGRLQMVEWVTRVTAFNHPMPEAPVGSGPPAPGMPIPSTDVIPPAARRRAQVRGRARTVIEEQDFIQQAGVNPRELMPPELQGVSRLPKDVRGVEFLLDDAVPDDQAELLQVGINTFVSKSEGRNLQLQMGDDIWKAHIACSFVPLDGADPVKYLSPEEVIVPLSDKMHLEDVRRAGHYELTTIGTVRQEMGRLPAELRLTEYQLQEAAVANKWVSDSNQTATVNYDESIPATSSPMPYDHVQVKVFRFFFISWETKVQKRQQQDGLGNRSVRTKTDEYLDVPAEKRRGETVTATVDYLYCGSLLPEAKDKDGNPYAFGCRKAPNQWRDPLSKAKTILPYVFVALPGPSRLQQMIALLDDIQENWLRMRRDLTRALPAGVIVDMEPVRKMLIATGAKVDLATIGAVVGNLIRDGNFVFDGSSNPLDPTSAASKQPPIAPQHFGVPPSVEQYRNIIAERIAQCERISGVNQVAAGLNPEDRQRMGKATSEIAVDAADANLTDLKQALLHGMQGISYRLMLRTAGLLKINYAYTLQVEIGASPAEWQQLYAAAQQAWAEKSITGGDYVYLMQTKDLQQARKFLALRQDEMRDEAAQTQQANEQGIAMQQGEGAKVAQEQARQTLVLEDQLLTARAELAHRHKLEEIALTEKLRAEGTPLPPDQLAEFVRQVVASINPAAAAGAPAAAGGPPQPAPGGPPPLPQVSPASQMMPTEMPQQIAAA